MSGLGKIFDAVAHAKENEWRRAGTSPENIAFARSTGMDARDIATLRLFASQERILIAVRCPKATARAWHGAFGAKTGATKAKSGDSGLAVGKSGRIMVSDYDLMSVWKQAGAGFTRIPVTAMEPGAKRGRWSPEATRLIRALNGRLITRIQHGCQDDWQSADNPGVKDTDRFAATNQGAFQFLSSPSACAAYYRDHGLDWPYDSSGSYTGAG